MRAVPNKKKEAKHDRGYDKPKGIRKGLTVLIVVAEIHSPCLFEKARHFGIVIKHPAEHEVQQVLGLVDPILSNGYSVPVSRQKRT
jgi:hypothetical protein